MRACLGLYGRGHAAEMPIKHNCMGVPYMIEMPQMSETAAHQGRARDQRAAP